MPTAGLPNSKGQAMGHSQCSGASFSPVSSEQSKNLKQGCRQFHCKPENSFTSRDMPMTADPSVKWQPQSPTS